MIPVLLILIPLVLGLVCFFLKNESQVKSLSQLAAFAALIVAIIGVAKPEGAAVLSYNADWISGFGSSFALKLDGLSLMLCLLTAISFPIIFTSIQNTSYNNANQFFGLMLLAQAGLMGVFMAADVLLFYFFWELALIPVYFLCSRWGGERRVQVSFKFFIYTFFGSVLMLIGILYIYSQSVDKSFSMQSFYEATLSGSSQAWLFWLFFIAFAIKMPIFPFHTWQPDTYESSATPVTMVLSGLMVKMGVYGLLRLLLPVLPVSSYAWGDTASCMAVIGMIYASLLAIQQDDIKRLVAYSSIAHIGLMVVTVFSLNTVGVQGAMLQMFNHGINIIGMWILVDIIEKKTGARKLSQLGGIAQQAPVLTMFFVIIALANIALPLTNSFAGEFLMFTGIFTSKYTNYNVWYTVLGGLCIILSAVYTLNMIRKIFYGTSKSGQLPINDIDKTQTAVLAAVVIIILWLGVFPNSILNLTEPATEAIRANSDVLQMLKSN